MAGLLHSLKSIQHLDISYCANISDKAIQAISSAPWAANLQSFSASRCCKLTDTAVSALCLSSQDLRELDLSWCNKLTDSAIVLITFYLKRLRCLNISYCHNISPEAAKSIQRSQIFSAMIQNHFIPEKISCKSIAGLLSLSSSLESLHLAGLSMLNPISEGCSNQLRDLKIAECNLLTDSSVITTIKSCPSLEALDVSSCFKLSDSFLAALGESEATHSRIEDLRIKFCFKFSTASLIDLLAHRCRRLKYLDITGIYAIDDALVNELCQSQQRIATMMSIPTHHLHLNHPQQLEHLEMSMCSQITDVAVHQIVSACPSLRNLNVARCVKISDAARAYAGKIIVP
eukprot:gene34131-44101_t